MDFVSASDRIFEVASKIVCSDKNIDSRIDLEDSKDIVQQIILLSQPEQ